MLHSYQLVFSSPSQFSVKSRHMAVSQNIFIHIQERRVVQACLDMTSDLRLGHPPDTFRSRPMQLPIRDQKPVIPHVHLRCRVRHRRRIRPHRSPTRIILLPLRRLERGRGPRGGFRSFFSRIRLDRVGLSRIHGVMDILRVQRPPSASTSLKASSSGLRCSGTSTGSAPVCSFRMASA